MGHLGHEFPPVLVGCRLFLCPVRPLIWQNSIFDASAYVIAFSALALVAFILFANSSARSVKNYLGSVLPLPVCPAMFCEPL